MHTWYLAHLFPCRLRWLDLCVQHGFPRQAMHNWAYPNANPTSCGAPSLISALSPVPADFSASPACLSTGLDSAGAVAFALAGFESDLASADDGGAFSADGLVLSNVDAITVFTCELDCSPPGLAPVASPPLVAGSFSRSDHPWSFFAGGSFNMNARCRCSSLHGVATLLDPPLVWR